MERDSYDPHINIHLAEEIMRVGQTDRGLVGTWMIASCNQCLLHVAIEPRA